MNENIGWNSPVQIPEASKPAKLSTTRIIIKITIILMKPLFEFKSFLMSFIGIIIPVTFTEKCIISTSAFC